jgi:prolyl-tRNA synthetase
VTDLDGLAAYFAEDRKFPGWVEMGWSAPPARRSTRSSKR